MFSRPHIPCPGGSDGLRDEKPGQRHDFSWSPGEGAMDGEGKSACSGRRPRYSETDRASEGGRRTALSVEGWRGTGPPATV